MRIAITGSTGFVGAALVRYFHALGHQIIAYGRKKNPPEKLLQFAEYIPSDITRPVPKIQAEVCIHAAALAADNLSYQALHQANVQGTRHTLDAAEDCRYFVHISSSSVYSYKNTPSKESDIPDDLTQLSHYGKSKLIAERIVAEKQNSRHQTRIILRPRAIYGIGDRILLPRLLGLIKFNRIIAIGDLKVLTSLTHVDNIGYAIERCIERNNKTDLEIYNICDEEPYLLRNIVGKISASLLKKDLPFFEIPLALMKGIVKVAYGIHPNGSILTPFLLQNVSQNALLDIGKIRKDLNYRAPFSFDDTCRAIANWVEKLGSVKSYLNSIADAPWLFTQEVG